MWGRQPDRPHTPKLAAYDAVLRGRHHLFRLSPETWTRAKACFEQAIALDPAYADAHAFLSLGYFFMGMNGILPLRGVAHLVREEAQKALDLKPSEIGPRFLLGGIAAAYDYDWKVAAEHFEAALAANPSSRMRDGRMRAFVRILLGDSRTPPPTCNSKSLWIR